MEHIRRFVVLTALISLFVPSYIYAAAKPDTLVYEVRLKAPAGDLGTRKMQMKGANFVWEMQSEGIKLKFIKNDDGAFLIHPFNRCVGKYQQGTNRTNPMVFLPGPVGDVKSFLTKNKAKKAGTEKIDKTVCDVYGYTEKQTGAKCKLFVEPKTLKPLKLMMTGKKKDEKVTATYVSYKRGVQLSDSIFRLPKDLPIRPMPVDKKPGTASKSDKSSTKEPSAPDAGKPK